MKSSVNVLLCALLAVVAPAHGEAETPMARVVKLIQDLKGKVEKDGKEEQASFDTYACWCEKTLERKASDITSSKELIEETEILISKLKGEIASHGAEIAQLTKDIAANLAGQKEATGMRNKENSDYAQERTESEQCIGALEAAIKVLTGAGTKKGFLDTSTHKAQLLSVAAGVRSVLALGAMSRVSSKNLDMVKDFVAKPEDFMAAHSGVSAAQVGQNPFGDYAPQSTQIQGILQGMYDSFTADLEKDNANEAESQKSFEALIATKKSEHQTLEATLEKQETDSASKTKSLKESEVLKDDTSDQLAADEAFFGDSKDACKEKAKQWSVRTRLRTEELAGMNEAIKILSDGSATFEASTKMMFFQLASVNKHQADRSKAYGELKKMASQYKSLSLAKIAAAVQMGGHFDKVLVMIDDMVAMLRKEEAADIVHRDMCEMSQNANKNELADLTSTIDKANKMKKRLENTKKELQTEINNIKADIKSTQGTQADLLKFRNKESDEFKQALKDDTDAVALLKQAITALSKFYSNNKIAAPALIQKAPEYAKDADKAPEASFSGDYGGRSSESGGILAILSMLVEDTEKEIAEGRSDDADAEAKYDKQNGALQNSLDAQEETKAGLEEELASTDEKIDAVDSLITGKSGDKDAEGDAAKALATDCAWVKDHFQTRRDKRKDEIQGLVDAKAFLAGVDAGEDPLPPMN
jgi:hypothetical protein